MTDSLSQPVRRRAAPMFHLFAAAYFAALSLGAFHHALFSPRAVISAAGMDIDRFFYPVHAFVFDHVRQGELPLWNPHIFGGMPTLGNFQYALLYPPLWVQAWLPTNVGINVLAALHVALAGFAAAGWARARGVGAVGSLLAGTLFMFSGPIMTRVYGGHLTFLFVAAWAPLVMWAVDAIVDNRRAGLACLGGAVAVAMQVFGGYPQPVYYTAMAVAVYVMLRLICPRDTGEASTCDAGVSPVRANLKSEHGLESPCYNRLRSIGLVLLMCLLGAALAAAQLLPALDHGRELLRNTDTPREFSLSFSLPPENLLTLVAAHVFGDEFGAPYVGRWAMWETSLYVGVIGVALAIVGAIISRGAGRRRDRALAITTVVAVLLALGMYTPLYRALLHGMPQMSHFRAPARFGFLVTLFVSVLAGAGFDRLWQTRRLVRGAVAAAIFAGMFALAGLVVRPGISDLWTHVLQWLTDTAQQWPAIVVPDESLARRSAMMASSQLLLAALSLAQLAAILALMIRWRRWGYLLPLLAIAQVLAATSVYRQSFHPYHRAPADWEPVMAQLRKDERVLVTSGDWLNLPMQIGIENVSGYDPSVSTRWAKLVAPLLGVDPLRASFDARRIAPSPVWSMLRVRTTLPPDDRFAAEPMPRLHLLRQHRVVDGPTESLRAVHDAAFDPSRVVILEREPNPRPEQAGDSSTDQVTVLDRATDRIDVTVELDSPALLLLTDAYSAGWRVRALAPGPQDSYDVLPANHALRAIPLAAGVHHLRHEYLPASIHAGAAITCAAIGGWCVAWATILFVQRGPRSVKRARASAGGAAMQRIRIRTLVVAWLLGIALGSTCEAQAPASDTQAPYDDRQNMMDQLGIRSLRRGPSPNDPATYDLANANRYLDSLPDVLTMTDGTRVTRADQWPKRRAQILEDFEREIYGRVPDNVPTITWEITQTTHGQSGSVPTVTKTLVGHVDNSAYPQLTVDIQASFTVPANAASPVPMMIRFGRAGGSGGRGPASGRAASRPAPVGPPWTDQAIARGWGYGYLNPTSIQPDNNRLLTGIIGLTNKGQPRTPEQWGALRAWGWGVSRLIDYFEQHPDARVDPTKIGIEGVSRYGKAAIVAQAFDQRIAVGLIASSGQGGTKLHRRMFGETVENLAGGAHYWMAGNYMKYAGSDPPPTCPSIRTS